MDLARRHPDDLSNAPPCSWRQTCPSHAQPASFTGNHPPTCLARSSRELRQSLAVSNNWKSLQMPVDSCVESFAAINYHPVVEGCGPIGGLANNAKRDDAQWMIFPRRHQVHLEGER